MDIKNVLRIVVASSVSSGAVPQRRSPRRDVTLRLIEAREQSNRPAEDAGPGERELAARQPRAGQRYGAFSIAWRFRGAQRSKRHALANLATRVPRGGMLGRRPGGPR